MKQRKGLISHLPNYSVAVKYSDKAIKHKLFKFIPKGNKPIEISQKDIIDILAKYVNQDILGSVLVDSKLIEMISVERVLRFTPSRDIKAGEEVILPFNHMMPLDYAVTEEALGICSFSDKVKAVNQKKIKEARERIKEKQQEYVKAAYANLLKENSDVDNQEET